MPVIPFRSTRALSAVSPPLRRPARHVDPRFDLFAFYVPHRHIYGDKWIDFIVQGIDENVTLDSYHSVHNSGDLELSRLLSCKQGFCYVRVISLAGYNRIWNRYFRVPSDQSNSQQAYGEMADTMPCSA